MAIEMRVVGEIVHVFLLMSLYAGGGVVSFTGQGEANFPRGRVSSHSHRQRACCRLLSSLTWSGACALREPRRA